VLIAISATRWLPAEASPACTQRSRPMRLLRRHILQLTAPDDSTDNIRQQAPMEFSRTLRSIEVDRFRFELIAVALAMVLLAAWGLWFFLAKISLYEVSESARIEVNQAVHPLESPLIGRVAASVLTLGQRVRAGDVLVELETRTYRLELAEVAARRTALTDELDALERQIESEQEALRQQHQAKVSALNEARSQLREAKITAERAADESARFARLGGKTYVSENERLKTEALAKQFSAVAETRSLAIQRLQSVQQTRELDRKTRIEALRQRSQHLQGRIKTDAARVERLEYAIERRRIRAPIDGTIGEISEVRVGVFVDEGDRLGAIIPDGELKTVAWFRPSAALGRIRPGQTARVRIFGFPWTQYGMIAASVARVGSEAIDGRVRIEFALDDTKGSAIPLQHGLPGTVEVEVERLPPATVLLRMLGRLLAPSRGSD
jgi:multidrug resistance efflux pump